MHSTASWGEPNSILLSRMPTTVEHRAISTQLLPLSWAKIEGHCEIEYEVVGDQTQFRLGGQDSGLELIFTEKGLATMVEKSTAALKQMRQQ